MARNKKIDLILDDVVVESVAAEGKAIAHAHLPGDDPEGPARVVFIEFAVPGDVVKIRVVRKKKSFAEGRIIEIKKPSDQRLEPFCEHFGVCGGCKWQPLPYSIQLEAKQRQVFDQLKRIGHLDIPEISPIIGSDKTREYRNKLEFTASDRRWLSAEELAAGMSDEQARDRQCGQAASPSGPGSLRPSARSLQTNVPEGLQPARFQTPTQGPGPAPFTPGLGFHVGKFFDKVLDINRCHLQPEPSNAIRLWVRKYLIDKGLEFYNVRENEGFFRNMFVRTTDAGAVMVIMCFAVQSPAIAPMLDALAAAFPEITSLYYIINDKKNDTVGDLDPVLYRGDEAIYEQMEGLRFKIGPKSFYQTNTGQAYKLYKVAREFARLTGDEVVYDLYTGTGTIAQFVSARARKVIGIEYVPEAIADARINAEGNGITNCEFFAGDMKDVLNAGFIAEHGRPDVMIVDPPRAGMHPDVVKVILDASPQRIVYVSCNPASQARDLAMLSDRYSITAVQPVDMFPHTQHVENVCALELLDE